MQLIKQGELFAGVCLRDSRGTAALHFVGGEIDIGAERLFRFWMMTTLLRFLGTACGWVTLYMTAEGARLAMSMSRRDRCILVCFIKEMKLITASRAACSFALFVNDY